MVSWSNSVTPGPDVIEPSSQSSVVRAQTLEMAKKLSDVNLPPLDLTDITSQPAEGNIEAVIKDYKRIHTCQGKEVLFCGTFGEISENNGKVF